MSKIVMFSDLALPTFPYLEVPMYKYIENAGTKVLYVLQDGDVRLSNDKMKDVFGKLNITTIKSPKHILSLMDKSDVLLMRFAYKIVGGDVANKVRAARHKILMYDPSGIDIRVRACPAQWLTVKSESLKAATIRAFPKQYKKLFVVGTIHNDLAAVTKVDRNEFMISYGMDPNKKFVILTPANPGELGFHKGINNEYKEIINIVTKKCPNYEIAVKAHPYDYMANMTAQPGIIHKNVHYNDKPCWEQFAPGIKVIKADEGYMALKACDVVIDVRSSVAMEAVMFMKPVIFVNRSKYVVNWPFDPSVMMDIKMDELEHTLNKNNYKANHNACLTYIKREMYSNDGKAYKRTANIAIKILNGKIK